MLYGPNDVIILDNSGILSKTIFKFYLRNNFFVKNI
jgi:hypothetical protein